MNSLQEALSKRRSRLEEEQSTERSVTAGETPASPPRHRGKAGKSRRNTHLIGGHFSPEVARQWHLLVAEEKINGATGQSLLEEALSDLFVKKGKKALQKPVRT